MSNVSSKRNGLALMLAATAGLVVSGGCVTGGAFATGWLWGDQVRSYIDVETDAAGTGEGPNGCGPGGVLVFLVPECPLDIACFTPACNNHDLCYVDCDATQSECDDQFYAEMLSICAEQYTADDPNREVCDGLAYIYWQGVARLGEGFFEWSRHDCPPPAQGTSKLPAWEAIPPFLDADDDLLPDEWEWAVGCDATNPADALEDYDQDGLNCLQEYLFGTDPLVADTAGDGILDGEQATLGTGT